MNMLRPAQFRNIPCYSVLIHNGSAAFKLFLRDNGLMVIFFDDPVDFRTVSAAVFLAVVYICSNVKFVPDYMPDKIWTPFITVLRLYSILIKGSGNFFA